MTTATKTYEGTKRVHAHPMNRGEYNAYRGWEVPADENPADDGYLVEYLDGGKPNHPGHAGYISWSPKDVFERAYCEVGQGMSFGDALKALKAGQRLAAPPSTKLTPTDVRWAEDLIRQLPADHEGRNSWLLNFGTGY